MRPLQCAWSEAAGWTCYAWTSAKPRGPGWGWLLYSPQKIIQITRKGSQLPTLTCVRRLWKARAWEKAAAAAVSVGFGVGLIPPVSSADVQGEDWTENLALSKQISVIPDRYNPRLQGPIRSLPWWLPWQEAHCDWKGFGGYCSLASILERWKTWRSSYTTEQLMVKSVKFIISEIIVWFTQHWKRKPELQWSLVCPGSLDVSAVPAAMCKVPLWVVK